MLTFTVWHTTVIFTTIFKSDFKQEDNHNKKKTIVGYLPRHGPKGILGVNTIITEGVEEAMTKGKINGGTMAGPRSQARPRTRQRASTEETEKLYNS